MNPSELKLKLSNLTIWKKDGQRAPHKPLLLNNKKTHFPYEIVHTKLEKLLKEFGPIRKSYHPEEPFVRLTNDGIWKLSKEINKRNFSSKQLLTDNVIGGFNDEVIELPKENQSLIQELAYLVLEEHFPDTVHEDILKEVGLDFSFYKRKKRDPFFRDKILKAYEYSCAVCGFNVRLGSHLVAIEAAHIKWHQAGGPDEEENGIALCSLHHKLFDRGVFTFNESNELLVAEEAHGTQGFEDWLMRFHGKQIRQPIRPEYKPNTLFVDWHVREVFRGPSRYYA